MQDAEKRRKPRRSLHYPGSILLGDDSEPLVCTLNNVSDAGAQLVVADAHALPEKFILMLGYDGTARRHCRVVWRKDGELGVEFAGRVIRVDPPRPAPPPATPLRRRAKV